MTRRTLLLTPCLLAAQSARPSVSVRWIVARSVPPEFARESVVFPRAYLGCPDATWTRVVLERGRFPHDRSADARDLTSFFGTRTSTNAITVLTTGSGDGGDSPFDRSLRVPLAIRWPGHLTPRVADDLLISHVDILPTLLGMAGIPAPAGMHGRDVSSLILNRRGPLPNSIYAQGRIGATAEWRMVLRGFDKIIWNLRDEVTGLYNLADDPEEAINLTGNRSHRLTQDSMMALARQWMQRLEDGMDSSGLRLRR